jgi:hypothetical protein
VAERVTVDPRRLSLRILLLALALAVLLTSAADAARKPTQSERAAISRTVLLRIEHDYPTYAVKVTYTAVSTAPPGAGSVYSKFAVADFGGRDEAGQQLDPLASLVGFSRRFRAWVILDYGSSGVGCRERQAFFGGRRAAILRDLNLACP